MANAKPAMNRNVKANRIDPNIPSTLTMVRCEDCGTKRCIEKQAECECGGKKKAKKAAAKPAPAPTPDPETVVTTDPE